MKLRKRKISMRLGDKALEPRVAILETSVEQLTNNVEKLVTHGEAVERGIHELTVLVTKAGAPKRTDWQTIISFVFLLGTVVSAIYWPLNMRMNFQEKTMADTKERLQRETELITQKTDKEVQTLGDRLIGRLNLYDSARDTALQRDIDELRQWRMNSMMHQNKQ